MHTANLLIVLTFLATLACAELDLSTVESHGAVAASPRTDGQLRMRNDELKVEGLALARMKVDGNKAIAAAEAKEVAHKTRTPQQRVLHASKTPLTVDIEDSHTKEKQLKEAKIKREEKQAKELKAKQEREAKRIAELKTKETRSKEQEAKDKEKAEKAAAKALAEKNEAKSKKDARDEKQAKALAKVAKEESDKEAAKLAVEQEKQAKSKEKLDKVESARAKLVKDKKDAEQTLIDGPKVIEQARKKIGNAKAVLANLHATSPEGIAEAKKEKEEKAKEKAAKESESKAKEKADKVAAKKKAAVDKENADKVAEKGVKLQKKEAAAEVAKKDSEEKKAKAKAAKEKELEDKDKEKKAKAAEKKAAADEKVEKAAAAAAKTAAAKALAKKLADQEATKREQAAALANEFKTKAAAKKAEEEKDQKAANEAAAAAKKEAAEVKAAEEKQAQEAKEAAEEAEADEKAEKQMAKDHKKRDEQEAVERKEKENSAATKVKELAKKEALDALKYKNAKTAEAKRVAGAKQKAERDKIEALEEMKTKKQEAKQAVAARAAKEKSSKEAAKEAAEVKEGDGKRKAALDAQAINESTEKEKAKMKREMMKQSMIKMNKLKADIAAAQEADEKRKQEVSTNLGIVSSAMNKEKAFKIRKQQEEEKAYLAMMNDPAALLKHLRLLGKQYLLQVAANSQRVASDDAQKLLIDKMVLDLRAEQEPAEAAEMKAEIDEVMQKEQKSMRLEMRIKTKATKLELSGSAAVDQLQNLERIHPNSVPIIRQGIATFNKVRYMADQIKLLASEAEKKAKRKGEKELVALEADKKEEKVESSYPFANCECTTALSKVEIIYQGIPQDIKVTAGVKTCFSGTVIKSQTFTCDKPSGTSVTISSTNNKKEIGSVNLNCSLPVFVGQTSGDFKILTAEGNNGALCDRPSPRQLTNQNNTVPLTEEEKKAARMTTHEHFSAMIANLRNLANNWDSAVKSPVEKVEKPEEGPELTAEQLAAQQAKAALDAETAAALSGNAGAQAQTQTPAPTTDAHLGKLEAEAAEIAGGLPASLIEVVELDNV